MSFSTWSLHSHSPHALREVSPSITFSRITTSPRLWIPHFDLLKKQNQRGQRGHKASPSLMVSPPTIPQASRRSLTFSIHQSVHLEPHLDGLVQLLCHKLQGSEKPVVPEGQLRELQHLQNTHGSHLPVCPGSPGQQQDEQSPLTSSACHGSASTASLTFLTASCVANSASPSKKFSAFRRTPVYKGNVGTKPMRFSRA